MIAEHRIRFRWIRRGIPVLAAVALASGQASAGEWTRFRGPDGSGISEAKTVPVEFTEDDYNWMVDLGGAGRSSPVIWENRIFVTVAPDDQPHARRLLCLDVSDGKEIWRYDEEFDEFHQHKLNRFASSTPAVDQDYIYLYWVSGDSVVLQAVNHDGKPVWKRKWPGFLMEHGHAASPILFKDTVVIANDQQGENAGFIMGLDRKSGETVWEHKRSDDKGNYSTPSIVPSEDTPSGMQVVFVSCGEGIMGVDPEIGTILWKFDGEFEHRSVGSAIHHDGIIFATVGSGNGGKNSAALRPGSKKQHRETEVLYRPNSRIPYVPTPISYGGRFYFWNDGGNLHCVNPETGDTIYLEGVPGDGGYYASPICIDGKIYGMSRQGDVVVVATGDEFKILGVSKVEGEINATPAVDNGVLYIRTDTHLISIGGER